jgi:cytochrome c biogenesis protein
MSTTVPTEAEAATGGPLEPPEPTTFGESGGPIRWGPLTWARWAWRQLTAMRTALFLLFLLALAAIPGSLLPQRAVNPGGVAAYQSAHKLLAPVLDRLSMFDAYSSPWFASVYLLLMVSLIGCVLPRTIRHAAALRRQPPPAPRNLDRLALHERWTTTSAPDQVLTACARTLRARRYRVAVDGDVARAEKGILRETGNLAFHVALLGVLVGIAVSSLLGIKGEALLVEGDQFVNQPGAYDSLTPGPLTDVTGLPPFAVRMDDFSATYQSSGPQRGAPTSFRAVTHVLAQPGSPPVRQVVEVNHPLSVDGFKMFLTGHGYAPVVLVRDATGRVVYDGPAVFLPQDGQMTSTGVVKVPDARPGQLGFSGLFLPTAAIDPARGPVSLFPAAKAPALILTGFAGSLGVDSGRAQSVYRLDTSAMTQLRSGGKPWSVALRPGQTAALPDARGSITFTGAREYGAFRVAHDPGGPIVLAAMVIALAGLVTTLSLRQRRVWVRVRRAPGGGSLVDVGALARNQAAGTRAEFPHLVQVLRSQTLLTPTDAQGGRAGRAVRT